MSDYAETCSMCGQMYSAGLDQEKEIARLKKLVRSAYAEGFIDGMGNKPSSETWDSSQSRMCLEHGFEEGEYLRGAGYTLFASFDTDDDCELVYEGKSYCRYGADLRIMRKFPTVEVCKEHLKTIEVTQGQKASEYVQGVIDDFISGDELEVERHGNQVIEIRIWKHECN